MLSVGDSAVLAAFLALGILAYGRTDGRTHARARAHSRTHARTHTHTHTHILPHKHTHTHTYIERQTNRQTDRQTESNNIIIRTIIFPISGRFRFPIPVGEEGVEMGVPRLPGGYDPLLVCGRAGVQLTAVSYQSRKTNS